jgi:hypothetical protein
LSAAPAWSQTVSLEAVAARLERVEQENAALRQQISLLQQQVETIQQAADSSTATRLEALEEKVDVDSGRLTEQAQVKVETTQRAPLRLTGMVLFNAFRNGTHAGPGNDYPGIALVAAAPPNSGATMRQSVLGIEFDAPEAILGGQFHGALMMDLFAGTSPVFTNQPRLRTAWVEGRWNNSALLIGQDKLIMSPREPNSLAQVVFSPLIAAGNLYGWRPQVRFTQRMPLTDRQEIKIEAGVTQTAEDWSTTIPPEFVSSLELRRPGPEGHFQFTQKLDEVRRIELGTGFHASDTHIARTSIPSRAVSLDWFANPVQWLEISGAVFTGKNVTQLSGRRIPGMTLVTVRPGVVNAIAVRSHGGWAQATILASRRLSFNLQTGFEDPDDRDLLPPAVSRNRIYVANTFYRLAPNVVTGVEVAVLRTHYKGGQRPGNTHYNGYLAYLF